MGHRMRRNKFWGVVFVLAVLSLWYAMRTDHASAANSLPDLIELAPPESNMIAYADLEALRGSPLVQQLAALAQPTQVDRDYANFVSETGFDYQQDLDRVLVASSSHSASAKTLVFAEGRFDQQKIEQYALRSGKIEEEGGHRVYVVPSAASGKVVRFAFLAPGRIALSDGEDLSAAISANSSASLDPVMRERLLRVADAPIFATLQASEFARAVGRNGSQQAGVFAALDSLRWVNLAAKPSGDDVILSAEGECDSAEQAQKIANGLELMRGLFRGALANPKAQGQLPAASAAATGELLEALTITTDAARVRLLVSVTPQLLSTFSAPAGP